MGDPEGRMDKCDLEMRVCLAIIERCQENKLQRDVLQKRTPETRFSVVLWYLMGLQGMVIRRGRRKEHETSHIRGRTKININGQTPWLKGELQEEMLISSYSEHLKNFKFLIYRLQRRHPVLTFLPFSIRLIFTEFKKIMTYACWDVPCKFCKCAGEGKIN